MLTAANFVFPLDEGAVDGFFSGHGLQALKLRDATAAAPVLLHSAPNRQWGRLLYTLLENYFAGMAVSFHDIPLDLAAGTVFQQAVWRAAATTIPHGAHATYGELARRIGKPGAARAVGTALGANPVSIVVPCHRVLAANNRLGGFSSGLHWKRRLLHLEHIPFFE